jgi:hypothetical protein
MERIEVVASLYGTVLMLLVGACEPRSGARKEVVTAPEVLEGKWAYDSAFGTTYNDRGMQIKQYRKRLSAGTLLVIDADSFTYQTKGMKQVHPYSRRGDTVLLRPGKEHYPNQRPEWPLLIEKLEANRLIILDSTVSNGATWVSRSYLSR